MRKDARETAFEVIFASQFTNEFDANLKNALIKGKKLDKDDIEYLNRVIALFVEHKQEILKAIDERSAVFPESGIFPADKSVLELALAEIMFMEDIPNVVSANEAANLASKFSSPKSADFVSGILADILRKD